MIKYPLIFIEWCDAIEGGGNWVTEQDAVNWCENEDWLIRQASYLLKETEEYLLLASKLNPQEDGRILVGGLQKIPRTWIRERKDLTELISSSLSQPSL